MPVRRRFRPAWIDSAPAAAVGYEGAPGLTGLVNGRSRFTGAFGTRSLVLAAVLLVVSAYGTGAAPGPRSDDRPILTQEWMSGETAAALDLGFAVLAPAAAPGPFGGEPSVYAAGGYYSLYWVIYGGDPTFLEITGEVGGEIPDGSVYDLNVPLVVNAEVQGHPAYRDLTPIYDTVWWQAGDVVYSVSSRNLTGADSLSLANALIVLAPPVGGGGGEGGGGSDGGSAPIAAAVWPPAEVPGGRTVTVWVEGDGIDLDADGGLFVETGTTTYPDAGGLGVEWQAPEPASDLVVSFVVIDRSTGEWLAVAETVVAGSGSGGEESAGGDTGATDSTEADDEASAPVDSTDPEDGGTAIAPNDVVLGCPDQVFGGRLAPVRLRAPSEVSVEAAQGGWPDEPGNRRFDASVDGGPDVVGVVPDGGPFFLHWRAPTVQTPIQAAFVVRDPDGGELVTCTSDILPAAPVFRLGGAIEGDGSGGPFPDGPPVAGDGAGDGSGGPPVPLGDDGGG